MGKGYIHSPIEEVVQVNVPCSHSTQSTLLAVKKNAYSIERERDTAAAAVGSI